MSDFISNNPELRFVAPPDPWRRFADIAERLGVEPHTGPETLDLSVHLRDGRVYDIYKLIHAILDRVDMITKEQPMK